MSRFSTIPMWRQNRSSIRAAMASVTLLLLAGLLDACGDRQEQSPASLQPAHRPAPIRPATSRDFPPFSSLLAEAVDTSDPMRSLTLGPERVAWVQARLERASSLDERHRLTFALGREQLWAGRAEDAIEAFRAAAGMLEESADCADCPPGGATGDRQLSRELRRWLAISYFRLGEQENCLALHSAASCLLPIRGRGRHVEQRGSRSAIAELTALLDEAPIPVPPERGDRAGLRWLLNLAAMTLGEFPDGVPVEHRLPRHLLEGEPSEIPRFTDRAADFGLDVVGLSGGVVFEDFDRDGWLDVMVSSWGVRDPLRVLHNNGADADGNVSFTDTTSGAGLDGELGGLNLIHADDNNDGYPDVLVLRGAWMGASGLHPNSLLRNNGDGTFANVTLEAGLLAYAPSQTAAWGDYDGDGWLDLFVGNEAEAGVHAPCQLFRNNADGTYTDVAPQLGLDVSAFVKGVAWGDYDDDGRLDLYLSILGRSNRLMRNQGADAGWRFADVTTSAGVGEPLKSFATWFWDYDNDGRLDLLAASYSGLTDETLDEVVRDQLGQPTDADRPRLYRNRGDGTFEDVTRAAGLYTVLLAMGAGFGDLDNDGFLDAYFGTGEPSFATLVPNRMFHNQGGTGFRDVSLAGGFGHLQKGHGVAFVDFDHDGDQDVFAVIGGAYTADVFPNALFVNPGNDNHWLALRLEGTRGNRSAIGARVEVRVATPGGERSIFRTVSGGGSFGSASLRLEIGLGSASEIIEVLVRWPVRDRYEQRFTGLRPGTFYRLREGEAVAIREEARASARAARPRLD